LNNFGVTVVSPEAVEEEKRQQRSLRSTAERSSSPSSSSTATSNGPPPRAALGPAPAAAPGASGADGGPARPGFPGADSDSLVERLRRQLGVTSQPGDLPPVSVMWREVQRNSDRLATEYEREWLRGQVEHRANGRTDWSSKETATLSNVYSQRVAPRPSEGRRE
jgi:hypothetical protein